MNFFILAESLNLGGWAVVGEGVAWTMTLVLMLVGMVGCVVPILPGHIIILAGALGFRFMLGREQSGLEWWSFVVLALLMAISQLVETVSGAAGSKWFGGTRWGALGALIGGLFGMFFMPIGLLMGPLVGAISGELLFARLHPRSALSSGVGSVVGTLAGVAVKLAVGVVMIAWFVADVFWIR